MACLPSDQHPLWFASVYLHLSWSPMSDSEAVVSEFGSNQSASLLLLANRQSLLVQILAKGMSQHAISSQFIKNHKKYKWSLPDYSLCEVSSYWTGRREGIMPLYQSSFEDIPKSKTTKEFLCFPKCTFALSPSANSNAKTKISKVPLPCDSDDE